MRLAALASLLLVLASAAQSAPAASTSSQLLVKFRVLVKFRAHASQAEIGRAIASAAADDHFTIKDIGVHVLRVPSDHIDAALSTLRRSPVVLFAERDGVVKPQELLPNVSDFLNSPGMEPLRGAWGWYQTHATQAWDITEGSSSVVAAVRQLRRELRCDRRGDPC
jgi:hypothetical protein